MTITIAGAQAQNSLSASGGNTHINTNIKEPQGVNYVEMRVFDQDGDFQAPHFPAGECLRE